MKVEKKKKELEGGKRRRKKEKWGRRRRRGGGVGIVAAAAAAAAATATGGGGGREREKRNVSENEDSLPSLLLLTDVERGGGRALYMFNNTRTVAHTSQFCTHTLQRAGDTERKRRCGRTGFNLQVFFGSFWLL